MLKSCLDTILYHVLQDNPAKQRGWTRWPLWSLGAWPILWSCDSPGWQEYPKSQAPACWCPSPPGTGRARTRSASCSTFSPKISLLESSTKASNPSTFPYCKDYGTPWECNVSLVPQRLLETQHFRPRRRCWILLNASKQWISKKSAQRLTGAPAESLGCSTWGSHAAMVCSSCYRFVVLSMDPVVMPC